MNIESHISITGRVCRRRHALLYLCTTGLLMSGLLCGCKPTEKNYREAYEAARAKRETVDADADLLSGGHQVERLDAPRMREVDGRKVSYQYVRIKPDTGVEIDLARLPYAVGISKWRMPTNARSQAADLARDDTAPFAALDNEGGWWTILGAYPTFEEAARAGARFAETNPGFPYIGLEEGPVVLCR